MDFGLFLLWPSQLRQRDLVIEEIAARFPLHRVYTIQWPASRFFANCYRFYGDRLSTRSIREKEGQGGPLTVVLLSDPHPVYGVSITSRGLFCVNQNLFALKKYLRHRLGTKFGIHGSNGAEEVDRDLALLLGINAKDLLQQNPTSWDGSMIALEREISGATGWKNLEELFYVLNAAEPYLILRNFEQLPHDPGEDIDFLTFSPSRFAYTCNAQKQSRGATRVNHTLMVNGQPLHVDLRFVGDGYFDGYWQRRAMQSRVLHKGGFYAPSPEDAFYTLVYHALFHKTIFPEKYRSKLPQMAASLGLPLANSELSIGLRELLFHYMLEQEYQLVEPSDLTLRFNKIHAEGFTISRERRLHEIRGWKGKVKRLFHRLKLHSGNFI